jgi:hypothetical protein
MSAVKPSIRNAMTAASRPNKPPGRKRAEAAVTPDIQDWQTIAKAIGDENDPRKLIGLVEQLCVALDRHNAARKDGHRTIFPGATSKHDPPLENQR